MPSTATVTGYVGAGLAITSSVFTNVTALNFSPAPSKEVAIVSDFGTSHIDISAATSITITFSSGVITATIS